MADALNIDRVKAALDERGMSYTELARRLGVSKESVSKWLRGDAMPRTDKLIRIAATLGLNRAQLIGARDTTGTPQVAFRMSDAKKASQEHQARAVQMGRLLEGLVPYLPFNRFEAPKALKNPSNDYKYIQDFVSELRRSMGVVGSEEMNLRTIASHFRQLQAVVIPVLWGHRVSHENAVHVYLPKSMTTWIYLNLDTKLANLKFWLAHELGHAYSFSTLQADAGEDFADSFAGALLFPRACAKPAYEHLRGISDVRRRVAEAMEIAQQHEISAITVATEVDRYAVTAGVQVLFEHGKLKELGQAVSRSRGDLAVTRLCGATEPDVGALRKVTSEVFDSPFFDALSLYVKDHGSNPGFVHAVLDCSLADAKEICSELA